MQSLDVIAKLHGHNVPEVFLKVFDFKPEMSIHVHFCFTDSCTSMFMFARFCLSCFAACG